ncbi:TIGR00159 family protein [candidate division WOR-1 bacterium RIFOXYB2_FULL_42_35]|uniref:Diadenylate cyclase n=1 Tax=candidate division WOR-1 bacterium RIFOXYC2_FULL_41_25 TaxID=1802586 RepID=A0A1F4TI95_UNCSA|nr:MAG: TIGR00159 family protein [candidate division WOR-1 bacterium RIFOXYA2_FULL_41_14]OGC24022.1 MAG: TIGR00159 family protein [candidate division WOR-1 bacterium RIFOXYB2_FULL_42_35]OGC32445.1 MAG: TIGR00159 family protein [candidate division WOR-1 bacterium RIFOXYC2_FULL_41_25]OGC43835.1 MAG: TIGR00159 family protein [candidate division WOR-1 bacterium RIFOXYD2_FULL_41_8]
MWGLPLGLRWMDFIDISIVAVMFYFVLLWLQGTRAIPLIRGVILILFIYLTGKILGLYTINWLFDKFVAVIAVMLVVLFQPELRRTLERFGRGKLLGTLGFAPAPHGSFYVRNVVRAVEQLSESKVGALILMERTMGLTEYLESGVRLDAMLSAELLVSIFNPRSPLHDGAVAIQGDRILAASCLLPLSESRLLDKRLGTRHRAAVGISELSDALAIVVSEKSGVISLAENGFLTRFLTKDQLEEKLFSLYKVEKVKSDNFPFKIGSWKIWKK